MGRLLFWFDRQCLNNGTRTIVKLTLMQVPDTLFKMQELKSVQFHV